MGRSLQIRPARVLETVTQELESGIMQRYRRKPPPWLGALQRIPPAEKMARTVPIKHQNLDESRMKGPRRSFIPQRLKYEEDHLRRVFYRHHPWELARPRIIVEQDGRDAERVHWGRGLQQPDVPLGGESVVQRQMWLMVHGRRIKNRTYLPDEPYNHSDLTDHPATEYRRISKGEAYDLARKELYELRHMEQVEQRIAHEEATYVGAYFGPLRLDISMKIEDSVFEGWKAWAEKEIVAIEESTKVGGVPAPEPQPSIPDVPTDTVKGETVGAAAPKGPTGPVRGVLRSPTYVP